MAIYTRSDLSEEVSNPSYGDKGYNSRGQVVYYTGDKWVSSGTWSQITGGPTISGNGYTYTSSGAYNNETDPDRTNPLTLDQVKDQRALDSANEWIARFESEGASATYDPATGYYTVIGADGQKYRSNSPTAIWPDIYSGPSYSGNLWDPYGDDTVGPLEVNDQFPDGTGTTTPVWVGDGDPPQATISYEDWLAGRTNPYGTGGGDNPIFNPPTTPTSTDSPFTPGPPEGIPLNPIVSQNPMAFSPYGQPAAQFSNIATYGGLPRSTGPWNTPGGYYGGNPYTQKPPGYEPPSVRSPGMPIDSPFAGGGIPDPNVPGPWLPPATPITLPDPYVPPPGSGDAVADTADAIRRALRDGSGIAVGSGTETQFQLY